MSFVTCKDSTSATCAHVETMTPEFVYAIRGERMELGRWVGSFKDLITRYVTPYGKILDIILFQCDDSRQAERHMFHLFKPFHWCNELYELDVLPSFMQFGTEHCMDSVQKTSRRRPSSKSKQEEEEEVRRFVNKSLIKTGRMVDHVQRAVLHQAFTAENHMMGKDRFFEIRLVCLGDNRQAGYFKQKKVTINNKKCPRRDIWLGWVMQTPLPWRKA